jgi:hypothetical protein
MCTLSKSAAKNPVPLFHVTLFCIFAPQCLNQLFPSVLLFARAYTPDEVMLFGKQKPRPVCAARGF